MSTVTIDAVDAVEIAEILEYFLERLDILGDNSLAALLFTECSTYGLDDLRDDVTRLIDRLQVSPLTP